MLVHGGYRDPAQGCSRESTQLSIPRTPRGKVNRSKVAAACAELTPLDLEAYQSQDVSGVGSARLLWLQLALLLACILIGARIGGIGLGIVAGVGLACSSFSSRCHRANRRAPCSA